jgi:eukaryotic-like serine/threonine-protein kinase
MWLSDDVLAHVGAVADEPDLSGTKYRMKGPLGRGGMGVVYAVHDVELGREVALKVSSTPVLAGEEHERLRREARILARLEHPGIVPVHDMGTLPDGRLFYVMKRVKGERLDAWVKHVVDRRARLRLFQRVCEAVALAHAQEQPVVHRDLKPENVMVGAFGEALVMDWGIAKVLGGELVGEAEGDAVLGTAAYMAPEQAQGVSDAVDARTDVYGLGGVLHFLLAEGAPGERALAAADPPVPPALVSIRARALAPAPSARYPGVLELAADVGRYLDGEPVLAHREGLAERGQRFLSKNAVVLSLLGAYVVLRLLLLVLSR